MKVKDLVHFDHFLPGNASGIDLCTCTRCVQDMIIHDYSDGPALCIVCQSTGPLRVDGFEALPRITSDCRVFPAGGELFVCCACSAVQKQPTAAWMREISEIYSGYAAYYQSGGEEQVVFDRASGLPRRRSDVLLERLISGGKWPAVGSALDVGCGNGVTLSSMSAMLPAGWRFDGFEIGDGSLERLKAIPGFRRLFTGSLASIRETFDLVTMIHSLEHFPSPAKALMDLLPIVGNGRLFVEVCNIEDNPFDILVADHLMHFSPATLSHLLDRCGFLSATVATDWVPKEISALARAGGSGGHPEPGRTDTNRGNPEIVFHRMEYYVTWLSRMAASAAGLSRGDKPFGLFGTSIAATWLASQLADRIDFFVDEDESRVGKQHMGRPILHPRTVPPRSTVYLALAPRVAAMIASRLSNLPYTLVAPPALNAG